MIKIKDSGIEWLGAIPSYWKICRLKNLATIKNGQEYKNFFDENGKYPVIGSGGEFAHATKFIYDKPSVLLGRKGTVDKPLFVDFPFWTVDTMYYTEIKNIVVPKFFFYLCLQIPYDYYQYGSALPSMTQRDLNSVKFPLPPLDEQKQIADYLDKKCSAIDSALDNAKKLVEKMREYKKSLITETVTKGLNPAAELVDSNIEWLGLIPSHWKIGYIKYNYFLKGRIGWQGLKASEFTDEGPFLVTGTDFFNGKVDWSKCYHITEERFSEAPEIHLKNGDLLVTKDGTVGKVAYIEELPDKASLNSHILLMRPLNKNYDNKFLYWIIQSDIFERYTQYAKNGTIMDSLTQEKIKNFKFSLPPMDEQKKIVEYLDEKCAEIDENISQRQKMIEKLTEYKKSLIYEVVTGKLEI